MLSNEVRKHIIAEVLEEVAKSLKECEADGSIFPTNIDAWAFMADKCIREVVTNNLLKDYKTLDTNLNGFIFMAVCAKVKMKELILIDKKKKNKND